MLYKTTTDWSNAAHKRVALFGMSGLGKTRLANLLKRQGDWFHYSVDLRIGSHLLAPDDSGLNINNLTPLAEWLGKPGDASKGGLPFDDYMRRQAMHRAAEIKALLETESYINCALNIEGKQNFICDTGGSICEVVNPEDPNDAVLSALSQSLLLVWIKGAASDTNNLIKRFNAAPKPMYYPPDIMNDMWQRYLSENNCSQADVNPDDFIRWGFVEAVQHRQPRYAAMARRGVTISAREVAQITSPADFETLIAKAIDRT